MHARKIINGDCSDEDAHVRNKRNEWNALNALKRISRKDQYYLGLKNKHVHSQMFQELDVRVSLSSLLECLICFSEFLLKGSFAPNDG